MKTNSLLLVLVILAGCGEPRDAHSQTTPRAAAPRPTPSAQPAPNPTPPPPPAPTGDLAGFAPDQVLSVAFKEINERGFPIVTLENLTGRDIDDIRGSFRLHDANGDILHATGLTIAVPGHLFIAADAVEESSPFGLNRKEDLMQRLTTAPDELSFSFEALDVTFMESQASAN